MVIVVEVSDNVKLMRKKTVPDKERTSPYLKEILDVEKIEKRLEQNYYFLEGRRRPVLRREILKV